MTVFGITAAAFQTMPEILEYALKILADSASEYCGGLINHGPMMAEAMTALGRSDSVRGWIDFYVSRLQKNPMNQEMLSPDGYEDHWPARLGNRLYNDWRIFFERAIAVSSWQSVLQLWIPRLSPGLIAAEMHGLIRTAHAVRNLHQMETHLRKRELASGLAYWASKYRTLPGHITRSANKLKPSEALRYIVPLPLIKRRRYGLMEKQLEPLMDHPPFEKVITLLDTSADSSRTLSDLSKSFACMYLLCSEDIRSATTLMHTVTAPSSARSLLPYLEPMSAENFVCHVWQAAAAICSITVKEPLPELSRTTFREYSGDEADLISSAIKTGDEHAVKFTEACLREHAITGEPVYLAAAWDAVGRISEISELTGT
jgi:hypothetical protein